MREIFLFDDSNHKFMSCDYSPRAVSLSCHSQLPTLCRFACQPFSKEGCSIQVRCPSYIDSCIFCRASIYANLTQTVFHYRLLGRSSSPRYQYDPSNWAEDESIKRMTITTGNLYDKLKCTGTNPCVYDNKVTLDADITCTGLECDVDTLRVVQVAPDVFYEYVRVPCVHYAFRDDYKTVFAQDGPAMCADPTQPVATQTCCTSDTSEISCMYHGEKVTYDTNEARCSGTGTVCPTETRSIANSAGCRGQTGWSIGSPQRNHFQWTSGTCQVQIKVRLDAMIALVHVPETAGSVVRAVENSVNNLNFFHVPWPKDDFVGDELFPNIDNQCGNGTCVEQDDWTCLCDVSVAETPGFTSDPTNVEDILSTLKIGAFPPDSSYSGDAIPGLNGVTVYHKAVNTYGIDTIFRIEDETDEFIDFGDDYVPGTSPKVSYLFLKNVVSNITIGNDANDYFTVPRRKPLTMRNPVLFHDLVKPEIRDSHYEVDAGR